MEKAKGNVAKSKSSNSAITTRSDNRSNKKSRSSAEFQPSSPSTLKKRGMYVEKKPTKLEINNQSPPPQKQVKPPPRPRPGQKRFLASVFTILSKSTASTQFPENNDEIVKEKKLKYKRRLKDSAEQTQDKKKHKYRSRVLNESRNERQKVVVLKPKIDIVQTPSNSESCQDKESARWLNLPRLVKQDSDVNTKNVLKAKLYDDFRVDMAINLMDSRKVDEKRVLIANNDPKTLVSDETKEKGLYNFFVDLLETTFNVYSVKPQYEGPASDVSVSKEDFVIDETVAKKLNVAKEIREDPIPDDISRKSPQQYFIKNDDFSGRQITDFKAKPLFPKVDPKSPFNHRKLRSKSFNNSNWTTPLSPKSKSPNRSTKKSKKKDLLSILKEQLKMDDGDFEEPQNLFQALQVMARNKRKCQKSIRFDKSAIKIDNDSGGDPECVFKRRNLMSISSNSTKKAKDSELKSTRSFPQKYVEGYENFNRKNSQSQHTTDSTDSYHTIEVYGFDYENPYAKRQSNNARDFVFPYHSSPSVSEYDYVTDETVLNLSESGGSSIFRTTESNVLKLN